VVRPIGIKTVDGISHLEEVKLNHCDSIITNLIENGILVALLALGVFTADEAVSAQLATGSGMKSDVFYEKQCFSIQGGARSQMMDPKMFDHVIFVKNKCYKSIKLKVCYHESDHCVDILVPPRSDKETWLGAFPSMRFFQYDAKEVPGLF